VVDSAHLIATDAAERGSCRARISDERVQVPLYRTWHINRVSTLLNSRSSAIRQHRDARPSSLEQDVVLHRKGIIGRGYYHPREKFLCLSAVVNVPEYSVQIAEETEMSER